MSDESVEIYVHPNIGDFNVRNVISSNAACDGRRVAYPQECRVLKVGLVVRLISTHILRVSRQ